jgi:NAD(P)-dependent dehydrogenase (short-subunit alcohol dehydrogenase family)
MQNRRCLVTGANSGIGEQTALALARLGAKVVMLCRDGDKGRAASERIRAASDNHDVTVAVCDLASQSAIRRFAAEFGSRFGRLDVLINNAGCYRASRRVTEDGIESTSQSII